MVFGDPRSFFLVDGLKSGKISPHFPESGPAKSRRQEKSEEKNFPQKTIFEVNNFSATQKLRRVNSRGKSFDSSLSIESICCCFPAGLPDGLFSNQKSQFGYISGGT
jgi:hypothetical protein